MSDTADVQERYIGLLQRSGEPEEFAAGTTVFSEGDPADRMYLVTGGSVSLSIGGRVVETVEPGGLFGEMAVIEREPRSGRRSPRPTRRSSGSQAHFWFLVQEPVFAEIVMRVIAGRLRRETVRSE
jgi:CRP-like cAMP-binding protein